MDEQQKPELINDVPYLALKKNAREAHQKIKSMGNRTFWRLVAEKGENYKEKLDRGATPKERNYTPDGDFWINQGAAGDDDFWDFLEY